METYTHVLILSHHILPTPRQRRKQNLDVNTYSILVSQLQKYIVKLELTCLVVLI